MFVSATVSSTRCLRALLVALAAVVLVGCDTLPRSGPDHVAIGAEATAYAKAGEYSALPYAVVDLTTEVLAYLPDGTKGSMFSSFGGGKGAAPEIRVGVGDIVQVTLFESAPGGLFIPDDAGSRPGNYVTLPQQTIDQDGYISVPYAGLVRAAGRTVPDIQQEIERRLSTRAIEPQAVVAVLEQRATEAAVLGEVEEPDRFAINAAGDRILDMISRAGGLKYAGYESFVTLQRGGRSATVYFDTLVSSPSENIYVAPGDVIYVYREQSTYLAFGATGQSGQYNFDNRDLSLAEAVAKAGGLLDDRADPGETFVYRMMDRDVLMAMGVDLTKFAPTRDVIPTIFRANFRNPTEYFVAKEFLMEDKDILYVSNAEAVELYKFLTLVNSVSSTVSGVATDAADAKAAGRYLKD